MSSPQSPGNIPLPSGERGSRSEPGEGVKRPTPHSASADPVIEEIEAEIRDHLATAAEQLQARGASPAEAHEKTQALFGDAYAIGRRCYWIKQGDTLMFRAAVVLLLAALSIGLAVVVVQGWRTQTRMADQMSALAEQLKTLAEKPSAPSTAMEQPPQEITGKVYAGSPNSPAGNKEVMIVDAKDGTIVRRVISDDKGKYRSGPLPAGDYCLVSTFETSRQRRSYYPYLQTGPVYVYPGLSASGHDLDVAHRVGGLAIELTRPLPKASVDEKYVIDARLMVEVVTRQKRDLLWVSRVEMPPAWPLHVMRLGAQDQTAPIPASFIGVLSNADLESQGESPLFGDYFGVLPAGEATIVAAVIADVIPAGYEPRAVARITVSAVGNRGPFEYSAFRDAAWQQAEREVTGISGSGGKINWESDEFFWMTKGLGKLWLERLSSPDGKPGESPKPFLIQSFWLSGSAEWQCHAPIGGGQVTRLRVEIPADLELRIKETVDANGDPADFAKFTIGGNVPPPAEMQQEINLGKHAFFRKVKIDVVGTSPLSEKETNATSSSPQ